MMTEDAIEIVNKETLRVTSWPLGRLSHADCYQSTNVRDKSTWTLVATNVEEQLAAAWQRGEGDLP